MKLQPFVELIKKECGLIVGKENHRPLEAAINARMNDLDIDSLHQFHIALQSNYDEVHRLADLVTINETYFFRENQQFGVFTDELAPELLKAKHRKFKVLSAGCASGEESYSLAISLMEKYGPEILPSITIVGCDIDRNAIRRAREGIYSKYSFRNTPPYIVRKYFRYLPDRRYRLIDRVKDNVQFLRINLLSANYPTSLHDLDVIFYRNVSIYFDAETRKSVFKKLANRLRERGYIFLSSTETYTHCFGILPLIKLKGIFLFQKTRDLTHVERGKTTRAQRPASPAPVKSQRRHTQTQKDTHQPIAGRALTGEKIATTRNNSAGENKAEESPAFFFKALSLAKVKRYTEALECFDGRTPKDPAFVKACCLKAGILMNLQRLCEAKEVCLDILKIDEWHCECLLLLGMIAKMEGNTVEAIQRFKEVIYIRPSLWLAHFYLGEIYTCLNEVEQAIREYDITINLLEKSGSQDPGITLFPLAFSEEHLVNLCRYIRDRLVT